MRKIFLSLILFSICAAAICLEPVGVTVPFNMMTQLRAESLSAVDVIAFPGSSFVKIHLKSLELAENETLTLSDGTRTVRTITGPYSGGMWLPSVTSGVAYLTLESKDGAGSPSYIVDEVGIGLADGPAIESVCGIDDRKNAVCYDSEKQTAGDPVGRMLFSSGGSWYVCTGSLVSQSGHFLTNNHCIEDQYGASSLEVWWRYQTDSCGGTQGTNEYATTGSQFLTTDASLDFTLLQLDDTSPSQKYGYLRIANRPPVQGEVIWIPQHGGGSVKKFSVDSDLDGGGSAKIIDDDLEGWISHSDIGYWADTEGGSSGSPVLDSNNKIIALHHFGLPGGYSCDSNFMNQGVKMSLIYPKIASYLGSVIPPFVSSVAKAANPFRLILQGTNFVDGMLVYIGSDTSPWPYYAYKSSTKFVLKGNNSLKQRFPKGTQVTITLVNPDGGTSYTTYTR
jgi:hypothetical protein